MKTIKEIVGYASTPRHSPKNRPSLSRREFLADALGTSICVGAVGGLTGLIGHAINQGIEDSERFKEEERKRREGEKRKAVEDSIAKLRQDHELRKQYERDDQECIDKTLWHNQAKPIEDVRTQSGVQVSIFQAQTEYNPNFEISVNEDALNQTINFLIGSMNLINDKNDRPIDPKLISNLQKDAREGKLDRVHLTVVTSATGIFNTSEGEPFSGGITCNSHPHLNDSDEIRHTLKPMICFSPDIFYPGDEIMTPEPAIGRFPKDNDTYDLPSFTPNGGESLSAYFGHEFSHVLVDILGANMFDNFATAQGNPNYNGGDYQEKGFVLPLNWFHTAALAGAVEGQPPIPSIFTVPDEYRP